jgi:hypothetical protein
LIFFAVRRTTFRSAAMTDLELKRNEVEGTLAELDRLLAKAEEAYELMAWAEEDENDE